MSFTEDWSGFFDVDEFADVGHLVSQDVDINGIFEDPIKAGNIAQSSGSLSGVDSYFDSPCFLVSKDDVIAHSIVRRQKIIINASVYVISVPPIDDGTGLFFLKLAEDNPNDTEESWEK